MRRPLVTIIDTPIRVNLANYEQRLQRYRVEFGLILNQIDAALDRLEADRTRENPKSE